MLITITLYQKEDARLHGDLIPIWVQNNLGAMIRITGENGSDEFVRITEDMTTPEYDVSIREASQSTDEKQETAIMLSTAAQQLMGVGAMEPGLKFLAESLQYYRLDGDVRSRLTEALVPKEQIDPAQFMQMQQQLQVLQQYIQSGQLEKTQSEAEKNRAAAMKTMREIGVTEAEIPLRHAQTVKTLEEAKRTGVEVEAAGRAETATINI